MKIGFSSNQKGLFPKLVRYFTRSKWSHCFAFTQDLFGEPAIIEASLTVDVVPFKRNYLYDPDETYEIWEILNVPHPNGYLAQKAIYEKYSGTEYGFLQIPYFMFKGLGLKSNPFSSGIICSELVYLLLRELGGIYALSVGHLERDDVSAQDLYEVFQANPHLYRQIEVKEK